jgi:hypothetical protein
MLLQDQGKLHHKMVETTHKFQNRAAAWPRSTQCSTWRSCSTHSARRTRLCRSTVRPLRRGARCWGRATLSHSPR